MRSDGCRRHPAEPQAPGRDGKRVLLHGFLIVTALVWLLPIAWALFTSFRPYADTAAHGYVSIRTR